MTSAADREASARRSLLLWRLQYAVAAPLAAAAVLLGDPWTDVLLVYVTGLSVWTGVETAHARLNADLPIEPTEKETT